MSTQDARDFSFAYTQTRRVYGTQTWANRDGSTVSVMTARESAVLFGYPTDWLLPLGSRVAQKAVGAFTRLPSASPPHDLFPSLTPLAGNSMCIALSKAIVVAAMEVHAASPPPPPLPPPSSPPHAHDASESDASNHELGKRVRALELAIEELRHVRCKCSC
jgi:hypothetical protein